MHVVTTLTQFNEEVGGDMGVGKTERKEKIPPLQHRPLIRIWGDRQNLDTRMHAPAIVISRKGLKSISHCKILNNSCGFIRVHFLKPKIISVVKLSTATTHSILFWLS